MIGKHISRYKILGQVGEGGMGVVYVAEDTVLGRRVAVKIPHADKDESHYRARFLREARAVSKLRHPNIAAVHDFGETDAGQPFIVMELVSGQTLGELLAGPGISIARAVEVARQVADALAEAHRLGVIHRDIKPSNVVIDEAGTVKVLDFGLAKQLHEDAAGGNGGPDAQTLLSARTRSDVVIGTPLYLSPEQARGSKVDGRSDLFALGALLYECLTGRPAFSGANVIEIGAQVLHFDPPPPSRLNPRVPAEIDRLTRKALAKKPEERFQKAEDFAAELNRVRAKLPDSDDVRTRRLAGADNGHRSSALITMTEGLRRPKFSWLSLVAVLAAFGVVGLAGYWLTRPTVHRPGPEVTGLYQAGVEAMREGSYYKASVLLAQVVAKDDDFVLAHARLAETLIEMDFLDGAKDEMLAVKRLAPDFSVFPREDALYLEAVDSVLGRNPAGAVSRHQEIAKLRSDQPQAHLDLGRAYERNNQVGEAVQSYTAATERDHSYAVAFLRLGTLHIRQNNPAGAASMFDDAQRLYAEKGNKEGEAAVRYQRGRLFATLSKLPEARAEFSRSLDLARETNNTYQQVLALLQLAQAQENGADGLKIAKDAIDLAQNSVMNDQVANGNLTIGSIFLTKIGQNDPAEDAYKTALQYALRYKLRRYEALARLNLGSLLDREGRVDEAEQLVATAREFFSQNGFPRDSDTASTLLARVKKRRGDYAGALSIFEEQLRAAQAAGDTGQVGILHRECGSALQAQEKYIEALAHYKESLSAARTLHNSPMETYAMLFQANVLAALGRYDDAGELLDHLEQADPKELGVGADTLAYIFIAGADLALSQRRWPEAAAKARQALAVLKEKVAQPSDLQLSWIDGDLGLAESARGAHARGRALCEDAARLAEVGKEPTTVAHAQYTLALALLEEGDAVGARDAALRAQQIFTGQGRADSEWRAFAVAAKASRLAGDQNAARDYMTQASNTLARFQSSLGAEATTYLSRPDVQWLRGELGVSAASATH
jgi:tetratricopeptide (TPR) repeat protein